MADILHHGGFPRFLQELQKLTVENYLYLEKELLGRKVIYDGPHAFIEVNRRDISRIDAAFFTPEFGFLALLSDQYLTWTIDEAVYARLSIVRSLSDLQMVLKTFNERLKIIQDIEKLDMLNVGSVDQNF